MAGQGHGKPKNIYKELMEVNAMPAAQDTVTEDDIIQKRLKTKHPNAAADISGLKTAADSLIKEQETAQKELSQIGDVTQHLTESIEKHKKELTSMRSNPNWAQRDEADLKRVANIFKALGRGEKAAAKPGQAFANTPKSRTPSGTAP